MEKNPLEKEPKIEVKLATSEDWEAFKSLKVESYEGEDSKWFGTTEENNKKVLKEIKATTKKYWEDKLSGNAFGVLATNNRIPIGMGLARNEGSEGWYMSSGFVKEKFRGGMGKKIFATRLIEISKRGGKKIVIQAKKGNGRSIHVAESFGFKIARESPDGLRFVMELNDVNDPEVIKNINEVLNAR